MPSSGSATSSAQRRRHLRWSGLLLLAPLLAGCAGGASAGSNDLTPTTKPVATAAGYPVSVDNCGTEVTITEPPRRILTIKSSPLELLLALGLEDRVVGTAFRDGPIPDQWAKAAAGLPVVSAKVPGQEATLDLRPDLVFAGWESNLTPQGAGDRTTLAKLGVNTYVAPSACQDPKYQPKPMTFEVLWKQIEQAGQVFGATDEAATLVAEQKEALAQVAPSDQGYTALWFSSGSKTPFVGGGIGAPQMIMKAAGLQNIAGEIPSTWTSLGWESIIKKDPDVIVLVDAEWNTAASKIQQLQQNPATAQMSAVRHHRYVTVPFAASEAGIRNVDAVASIVAQLQELP
jgi:iron complex transport system substrate-binding protein